MKNYQKRRRVRIFEDTFILAVDKDKIIAYAEILKIPFGCYVSKDNQFTFLQ